MVINIMLMEVTSGRGNVRNVRAADHNSSGRKWGMGSIEEEEEKMFAELRLDNPDIIDGVVSERFIKLLWITVLYFKSN